MSPILETFANASVRGWRPIGGASYAGVAAYFAGGTHTAGGETATVDKFTFPIDTRTTLGTGLSVARFKLAAFANGATAGYVATGVNNGGGTTLSTVDKFTFPTDTRSTLADGAIPAVEGSSGASNGTVAGFIFGGYSTSAPQTRANKWAFPSDTRTTLSNSLQNPRYYLAAASNNGVAAYNAGGGPYTQRIEKFLYSTDDYSSTLTATLSVDRGSSPGSFSNQGVAGYFGGGSTSNASVDKLTYSSETISTLGTGLSVGRYGIGGCASRIAGYFGGGNSSATSTVYSTVVDKYAFPADTRTTLASGLSLGRLDLAGFSNVGAV